MLLRHTIQALIRTAHTHTQIQSKVIQNRIEHPQDVCVCACEDALISSAIYILISNY